MLAMLSLHFKLRRAGFWIYLMQRRVPRVRRLFGGLCAARAHCSRSQPRSSRHGAFAWLVPGRDMMVKPCTAVSPFDGHSAGEHIVARFP